MFDSEKEKWKSIKKINYFFYYHSPTYFQFGSYKWGSRGARGGHHSSWMRHKHPMNMRLSERRQERNEKREKTDDDNGSVEWRLDGRWIVYLVESQSNRERGSHWANGMRMIESNEKFIKASWQSIKRASECRHSIAAARGKSHKNLCSGRLLLSLAVFPVHNDTNCFVIPIILQLEGDHKTQIDSHSHALMKSIKTQFSPLSCDPLHSEQEGRLPVLPIWGIYQITRNENKNVSKFLSQLLEVISWKRVFRTFWVVGCKT